MAGGIGGARLGLRESFSIPPHGGDAGNDFLGHCWLTYEALSSIITMKPMGGSRDWPSVALRVVLVALVGIPWHGWLGMLSLKQQHKPST